MGCQVSEWSRGQAGDTRLSGRGRARDVRGLSRAMPGEQPGVSSCQAQDSTLEAVWAVLLEIRGQRERGEQETKLVLEAVLVALWRVD